MIRGTTPTQSFGLPVEGEAVKNIRITYKQDGETVLEKKYEDVKFEGKEVKVDLSQEETLRFKADTLAKVQIRALTTDGKVLANKNPVVICVCDTYNEEILT